MKKTDQVLRDAVLQHFAAQLRAAREKANTSFAELSRRTGVSEQHLRRMEAGKSEPGLLRLLALGRALNTDLTWFLPATTSTEAYVEKLWARHRVADNLPGADNLDAETKRKILESMGVWHPPANVVQYHCLPVLPDRSALIDVLLQLPKGTMTLNFAAISGAHNLTASVLDHVKEVLLQNQKARMEFLLLDPDGKCVHQRALERQQATAALIERIQTFACDLSAMAMDAATHDKTVLSRFTLAFYEQHPVWRILSVDGNTHYVSYYPPKDHGSLSPVWMVEKTDAAYSLFGAHQKQYDALRAGARKVTLPYTLPERVVPSLRRRKKATTRT